MAAIYIYFVLIFAGSFEDVRVSSMITSLNDVGMMKYEQYDTEPKQEIVIRVMIHLDSAMALQMSKLNGYTITQGNKKRLNFSPKDVLKEVEKLYNVKSLNQNVNLKLINVKVVNNKTFDADENVSKYLRNYCTWQNVVKVMKDEPYFSVLLSGLDLYYISKTGRKVRESTGRGYMGRMCSMNKSCAVVKWHPKDLVYLLAHELAHSLGVYHDGKNNRCKAGFIMAPQYSRELIPKHWSSCSRYHLQEFLRHKEKSWCLSKKY